MRLALFEPEIPQNTGTLMRFAACMGLDMAVIEPCGFVWHHPSFKRSVMDYVDFVHCERFEDYAAFEQNMKDQKSRIITVDVKGSVPYTHFHYDPSDTLLMGKESTGLPETILARTLSVSIPMIHPECRSLNVATAAAMVLGEAIRQNQST